MAKTTLRAKLALGIYNVMERASRWIQRRFPRVPYWGKGATFVATSAFLLAAEGSGLYGAPGRFPYSGVIGFLLTLPPWVALWSGQEKRIQRRKAYFYATAFLLAAMVGFFVALPFTLLAGVTLTIPMPGVVPSYRWNMARGLGLFPLAFWFLGWLYFVARTVGHERWQEVARRLRALPPAPPDDRDIIICYRQQDDQPAGVKYLDRLMHTFVVGPTGSGKTQGVLHPMIRQDLANPRVGVLAIEPKGDWIGGKEDLYGPERVPGVYTLAKRYGRDVYIIDPAREDTDVFNPLAGDTDIAAAVNSLVLSSLFGKQESFFAHTQASLIQNMIYLLKGAKGEESHYNHLIIMTRDANYVFEVLKEFINKRLGANYLDDNLIVLPDIADGKVSQSGYVTTDADPEKTNHDISVVQWFLTEFFVEAGRGGQNKIMEHTTGLRMLLDEMFTNKYFTRCIVPREGARTINLEQILEDAGVLCVSTNDGMLGHLGSALGMLVATFAQKALERRTHPEFILTGHKAPMTAMYLDEFSRYVNEEFGKFLEVARGSNTAVVLGFQNLGQLEDNLSKAFRNVLIDQCATKIVYGRLGPENVKFFMEAFGTKEETVVTESRQYQRKRASLLPEGANRTEQVKTDLVDFASFDQIRFQEANSMIFETLIDRTIQRAEMGYGRSVTLADVPPKPVVVSKPNSLFRDEAADEPIENKQVIAWSEGGAAAMDTVCVSQEGDSADNHDRSDTVLEEGFTSGPPTEAPSAVAAGSEEGNAQTAVRREEIDPATIPALKEVAGLVAPPDGARAADPTGDDGKAGGQPEAGKAADRGSIEGNPEGTKVDIESPSPPAHVPATLPEEKADLRDVSSLSEPAPAPPEEDLFGRLT